MNKKGSIKYVLPILVFLACLIIIQAITFQQIFPTSNPFITNSSTVNLSTGIHTSEGLQSITQSINGTNYTLYDSSLVLFMNFDNRSALGENDTFVRDLSMYENNGTVVGGENITRTANGKYGGTFIFKKGARQGIVINSPLLNISNGTLSLWVYTNPLYYSSYGRIISASYNSSISWMLEQSDAYNEYIFYSKNSSGSSNTIQVSDIPDGWNNIILTWNGTYTLDGKNTMNFYVNGVLENPTDNIGYYSQMYSQVRLGDNAYVENSPFNGSIDELRIWNRTLSQNEITSVYNTQITKYNTTYLEYNTTTDNSANLVNYFICSVNSTDYNFCTGTSTFRQLETIKVNFSTSKGIVKDDFYGVNLYSPRLYQGGSLVDFAGASKDTDSINALFDNLNLKVIRVQASLNKIYEFNATTVNQTMIDIDADLVELAKSKGFKIIWGLGLTPTWNANTTITDFKCIGLSGGPFPTQNGTCPPINNTIQSNLEVDFLNRIGCDSNTCIVESINEPDLTSYWGVNMGSDSTNISLKSNYLNIMINESYYGIEKNFTNMTYLIPSFTARNQRGTIILQYAIGNFSNKTIYPYMKISNHEYLQTNEGYDSNAYNFSRIFKSRFDLIFSNCSTYSMDCSDQYLDEWGLNYALTTPGNNSFMNMHYASGYEWVLNNYPSNISMLYYAFDGSDWSTYSMFNSSSMDVYPIYNVTKNVAHLHPSGADVKVSSSDSDCIKQVSSVKGNLYAITLINTCDRSQNATLNLSRENGTMIFGFRKLTNYENSAETFTINSAGITQLGILDSYEILYLINDTQVPTITIDSPTNSTYLTNSVWMNVSLDEEGSMCKYSLNGGTNVTMTQSGVVSDFYSLKSSIEQITNYVIFYCNDTYNNWNSTKIYFTVSTPPTYSDNSVSNTIFGGDVRFSLTVTDDIALDTNGYWIFSSDNTGEWKNDTAVNFTSTPETISVRKNIIKPSNTNLSYRWYLYDNVGNLNVTETFSFTVACDSNTKVGYKLVMIIASLILLTFVISFSYSSFKEGKLDVGQLIMVFVVIVVCLALWLASGQNLGNNCGVIS